MIIVATDQQPLGISPMLLIGGRRSVAGWASGTAKDSEDAMAFAALKKIRVMVQTLPLDRAEDAYQSMSKARFRTVLKP
jgi:D-arabinose 1-dehydrogenase-like Zn-dependent alcohol dehydrogenase